MAAVIALEDAADLRAARAALAEAGEPISQDEMLTRYSVRRIAVSVLDPSDRGTNKERPAQVRHPDRAYRRRQPRRLGTRSARLCRSRRHHGRDALGLAFHLEGLQEDGLPVPEPTVTTTIVEVAAA